MRPHGGAANSIHPLKLEVWGGSPQAGYSWTKAVGSALPVPSLVVDPLNGVVTGSLPAGFDIGPHGFDVAVSDGTETHDMRVDLDVNSCDSSAGSGDPCPDAVGEFRAIGGQGSLNNVMAVTTFPTSKAIGFQISAIGGVPPYRWSVSGGTLPPGLILGASTGVIHGAADSGAAGRTFDFTVSATDEAGTALLSGDATAIPYSMEF